jgi:hypothetical protein
MYGAAREALAFRLAAFVAIYISILFLEVRAYHFDADLSIATHSLMQSIAVAQKPHIVIAARGRLAEHLQNATCNFNFNLNLNLNLHHVSYMHCYAASPSLWLRSPKL